MYRSLFLVFIAYFLTSCSGGGSSDGGVSTKSVALSYNTDHSALVGSVNLNTQETLNTAGVTKTVEFKNFVLTTDTACTIQSQTIAPSSLTFSDNTMQSITIDVTFAGRCDASKINLEADENVNVTASGTVFPTVTNKKQFSFSLTEANGEQVVAHSNSEQYQFSTTVSENFLASGSTGSILFTIRDSATQNIISSSKISRLYAQSSNSNLLKLIDKNGNEQNYIDIDITPSGRIHINAGKEGGTGVVDLFALLSNGKTIRYSVTIPIIQNDTATLSMVLKKTEYREPFFVDTYTLHAVDANGNPVKERRNVSVGVINQTKFRSTGDRLGTMSSKDGKSTFSIGSFASNFTSLTDNDRLVILPNTISQDPIYLGGWNIESVASSSILNLSESFEKSVSNLSYAIGDERRLNSCDATLAVADFGASSYTVENGKLDLELKYDPFMVGKDVFLYAQMEYQGERIGISRRKTLSGMGLDSVSFTCSNDDENLSAPPVTCSFRNLVSLTGTTQFAKLVDIGSYVCESGNCVSGNILISDTDCSGSVSVILTADPGENFTISVGSAINPEIKD